MNNTELQAELLDLSRRWAEAMTSNDADRIGSFMAEEWVMVSERGITQKHDLLDVVRSGRLTHSMFEMRGEARIRIYGNTALLTARVVNTAHFAGQDFDADEWTTDVFVMREGKWQCVLSQITAAEG